MGIIFEIITFFDSKININLSIFVLLIFTIAVCYRKYRANITFNILVLCIYFLFLVVIIL